MALASAETESHVAGEGDKIEETEVVEEGMSPVYAKDVKEGTYPVEMVSSSSMFKADHAELVVEGEEMKAILYMTSEEGVDAVVKTHVEGIINYLEA